MIKLQAKSQIIRSDETLNVFREIAVVYQDGVPVKYDIVNFQITCNVQPLNGRDLQMVPEGDREKEQFWLYVQSPNIPPEAKQDPGPPVPDPLLQPKIIRVNDRVMRNGISYQIQTPELWGSYTRARIMRIDIGPYSVGNNQNV